MEILWAGWRSAYVRGEALEEDRCLFCRLPELPAEESLVLREGSSCFAVLNRFPYTSGHSMVAPYRHVARLDDLTGDEWQEIGEMLGTLQRATDVALAPEGYNMGGNLGAVAGAGVPGHIHFHLVPRWGGDTNFMTTVADTRVIPVDLTDTWRSLREAIG